MLTFTKEQINEISEQLDCGFQAFYHKQTGELIFVPDTNRHLDMDTSAWQNELDKLDENFLDYYEIDSMSSSHMFRVMADFAEAINEAQLRNKLIEALNKNKPFREFKFVIENSKSHRKGWFEFKKERYIEWTEDQLRIQR